MLADTTIKLVVCGSSISLMETHLLGYQSPLYGRRTGQILLPPLKYYHLKEFIELPVDDIIRIYSITDGIPYYILDAAYRLKNNENLEDIFMPGRILFEEAEILIKYEFFECKYSTLKFKDALAILAELKIKSGYVNWNCGKRKEYFGWIAKKIADKERLRKEGYFIFDFDDF